MSCTAEEKKALSFESQIQRISGGHHLPLRKINLIAAQHAIVIHRRVQLGAERVSDPPTRR